MLLRERQVHTEPGGRQKEVTEARAQLDAQGRHASLDYCRLQRMFDLAEVRRSTASTCSLSSRP